jgi:hypothetical protein
VPHRTSRSPAHPDRPLLGAGGRALAGLVSLGALASLALAATLEPDPAGHGTHAQLGLPPCPWAAFGDLPCPTCGVTTAVCHAADGRLLAGFLAHPLGVLIALGVAAVAAGSAYAAATGSRLHSGLGRGLGTRTLWALGILALGAWVYKIATWTGPG